jgi:plasmid segregation protein ParM
MTDMTDMTECDRLYLISHISYLISHISYLISYISPGRTNMTMQAVGIDIGYGFCKAVGNGKKIIFPSVTGSADKSVFSGTNQNGRMIVKTEDRESFVGESALDFSRFIHQREDRAWVHTIEYLTLYRAAIACLDVSPEVSVVTGLPISWYADAESVKIILSGEHNVTLNGKEFNVYVNATVIPQPFGSLLNEAFLPNGKVKDASLLTGTVGVVDMGSKHTNVLTAHRASDVRGRTASIVAGGWDIVRAVKEHLAVVAEGLDLPNHKIVEAIKAREVGYFGDTLSLGSVIDSAVYPYVEQIVSEISQLWGTGADLTAIIITGGGAHLAGDVLKEHLSRHKRVIVPGDPVFANASGYLRYARFIQVQNGG